MCHSKMIYALAAGSLLAFCNVTQAVTYGFGNLFAVSHGYIAPSYLEPNHFAQLVVTDNGHGIWTIEQNSRNYLSSFGNGALLHAMSFDFTHDHIVSPSSSLIGRNQEDVTSFSNKSIDGGYAKYTPITLVTEPETYAMILVGLGLIGFSARHRNNDIFD